MTEIKAQEYLEINWNKDIIKIQAGEEKLTEDLIIQDYPNLEEIYLPNHELTALTITNCPKLKEINVRNNQLTKLEFNQTPQIEQIIAGKNEFSTLDLINTPKLKELILPDNPYLNEIKGLNLSLLRNININNTSVNLAQDYEGLKQRLESSLETIETLKAGGEEGKLMFTEAIEDSSQVDEAIQRHLQKTEKEWREYLKHPEKALPAFQVPESRQKVKKTLIWIAEAQTSRDYQELADKWNGGEKYNGENDFDCSSLEKLTYYLKIRNRLKKKEQGNRLSLSSNSEIYQAKP